MTYIFILDSRLQLEDPSSNASSTFKPFTPLLEQRYLSRTRHCYPRQPYTARRFFEQLFLDSQRAHLLQTRARAICPFTYIAAATYNLSKFEFRYCVATPSIRLPSRGLKTVNFDENLKLVSMLGAQNVKRRKRGILGNFIHLFQGLILLQL